MIPANVLFVSCVVCELSRIIHSDNGESSVYVTEIRLRISAITFRDKS